MDIDSVIKVEQKSTGGDKLTKIMQIWTYLSSSSITRLEGHTGDRHVVPPLNNPFKNSWISTNMSMKDEGGGSQCHFSPQRSFPKVEEGMDEWEIRVISPPRPQ